MSDTRGVVAARSRSRARSRVPLRALLVVASLGLATTSLAWAGGGRARDAWRGLPAPTDTAQASGRVALRAPQSGRVRMPPGTFVMGSTSIDVVRATGLCRKEFLHVLCDRYATQFRAQMLAHDVTLDSFLIDRTEVTVRDYGRCVAAGACTAAGYPPGDARFDRPELPVTHVRWEDSERYCAWAGGRLPTEAEWEYAARGPTSREYPWGNLYNSRLCNHGSLAEEETDATDGFALVAPVGSFPDGATPLGVYDLAGNVSEWVADVFFMADETGFGYSAKPVRNPKGAPSGGFHVIRGGSYQLGAAWMRAAWRDEIAVQSAPDVGFRCAADID